MKTMLGFSAGFESSEDDVLGQSRHKIAVTSRLNIELHLDIRFTLLLLTYVLKQAIRFDRSDWHFDCAVTRIPVRGAMCSEEFAFAQARSDLLRQDGYFLVRGASPPRSIITG